MIGIDLLEAQRQLAAWLQANVDVAAGRSVTLATPEGSRTVTCESGAEIRQQIRTWSAQVAALSGHAPASYATVQFTSEGNA